MPHDKNGKEIKAGDTVLVEMKVKSVTPGADTCNVELETAPREGKNPLVILTDADVCELKAEEVPGPTLENVMTKLEVLQEMVEEIITFTPPAKTSAAPPPPSSRPPNEGSSPSSFKQSGKPVEPLKKEYKPILRTDPPKSK